MTKIAILTLIAFLGLSIGLPHQLASELRLSAADTDPAHWPEWRGPYRNGMARGDAPTTWSDTKNIKWKTEIAGRGFSTPVIWGDKVFLTSAVQTGKTPEPTSTPTPNPPDCRGADCWGTNSRSWRRQGGPGGGAGAQIEHKFLLICLDRKTGKADLAKNRSSGHTARGLSSNLRELRLKLTHYGRQASLRLLRIARHLLL